MAPAAASEAVRARRLIRDGLATLTLLLIEECARDSKFKFEHRFSKRLAPLDDPFRAAKLIHRFIGNAEQELFVVVTLTGQLSPISIRAVHIGTIDASLVDPRDVFRPAVVDGAASIIIGHNHPSGDPVPSPEDFSTTHRLFNTGVLLGVIVEDHIIVSSRFGFRFYSFAEDGRM